MEMVILILLIQAVSFGAFCSFIAREKNRNSGEWFWLGFFFSFLAVLALIAVPKIEIQSRLDSHGDESRVKTKAVCPYCREEINPGAIVCKHCRSDLSEKQPIIIANSIVVDSGHEDLYEITCPKCNATETILFKQRNDPAIYKKFVPNFISFATVPHLRCRECSTKIPYYPSNLKGVNSVGAS